MERKKGVLFDQYYGGEGVFVSDHHSVQYSELFLSLSINYVLVIKLSKLFFKGFPPNLF